MKKKVIIVIIILVVLGAAIAVGVMYNKTQVSKKNSDVTADLSTDDIPDFNVYCGGEMIATIDGYTMEMNDRHMRDNIVPVEADNIVPMEIVVNKNKVESLTYQVINAEEDKLIDNGEIQDLEENDGKISFDYRASAIMEKGKDL